MPNPWSESEVEAAVADYFDMLRSELTGCPYNKTEHRRALLEQLDNRSHGSIERKHQNISAVLIEMGMPYVDGYKPLSNYQRAILPEAVAEFVARNPELQKLLNRTPKPFRESQGLTTFCPLWWRLPSQIRPTSPAVREPRPVFPAIRVNYLEREARNQALGDAGEEFVINFERARLIHAGKEALADRVKQVSATVGPSAGFDILSFEENGQDRFIEAKTTKHGKNTPFFVTPNELSFSRDNAARYFLYRSLDSVRNPACSHCVESLTTRAP